MVEWLRCMWSDFGHTSTDALSNHRRRVSASDNSLLKTAPNFVVIWVRSGLLGDQRSHRRYEFWCGLAQIFDSGTCTMCLTYHLLHSHVEGWDFTQWSVGYRPKAYVLQVLHVGMSKSELHTLLMRVGAPSSYCNIKPVIENSWSIFPKVVKIVISGICVI